MPTVTYDGRSFLLDGRRIWIVSGTLCYANTPRANWRDRIHAAKLAGLNAIEVPVVWARHEPLPKQFDFEGDNDLRHFVQLVGDAGLHCILRPGPYIGGPWEFGGLPAWVRTVEGMRPRAANTQFLEVSSRYITAVAEQVRHLQVTSPGGGGPILLLQNEASWTCGDDAEGASYLGELNRFLRESGFNVPILNANNLWQAVEGEIDGWVADRDLLPITRQLGAVRPSQPKLVVGLQIGEQPTWGEPAPEQLEPPEVQRRIAEVLAAGGQFNLRPFFGGTMFGSSAGHVGEGEGGFATTSAGAGSPLGEHGGPGPAYAHVRRICLFASNFARVLAHLEPNYQPVALLPDADAKKGAVSVVHAMGAQGQIVWVFGGQPKRASQQASLLLADGTTLPTPIGGSQRVTWCLFDVHLGGRTRLDYSSFSALALLGSVLVVFGPSGAEGAVSIKGSPIHVHAPTGKTPTVIEHEGITLVVLNEEQADRTFFVNSGLVIGADVVRADGTPVIRGKAARVMRIGHDGSMETVTLKPEKEKPLRSLALADWTVDSSTEYADGTSARYAAIDGPDDLISLGASAGYGWYRTEVKASSARRARIAIPQSADRVHIYVDGAPLGILGEGRGAKDELQLNLKRTPQTLVLLADNLGRRADGAAIGEPKGVYGHVMDIKTIRLAKPTIVDGEPLDVLSFRTPLWGVHAGDLSSAHRVTWKVVHRKRSPLVLTLGPSRARALLILNDEPVEFLEAGTRHRIVLTSEMLKRGANVIQVAPFAEAMAMLELDGPEGAAQFAAELASNTTLHEGATQLTSQAKWSFARWEPPPASSFGPISKNAMRAVNAPTWWRSEFTPGRIDVPISIDLTGMTKGQVFLNDRHLGRYWVASSDGKRVGPDSSLLLPEAWLVEDAPNVLVLFDEHGGNPSRCRVAYDKGVVPIRA